MTTDDDWWISLLSIDLSILNWRQIQISVSYRNLFQHVYSQIDMKCILRDKISWWRILANALQALHWARYSMPLTIQTHSCGLLHHCRPSKMHFQLHSQRIFHVPFSYSLLQSCKMHSCIRIAFHRLPIHFLFICYAMKTWARKMENLFEMQASSIQNIIFLV